MSLKAPWLLPNKIYVTWLVEDEYATTYETYSFDTLAQAEHAIVLHNDFQPGALYWVDTTDPELDVEYLKTINQTVADLIGPVKESKDV